MNDSFASDDDSTSDSSAASLSNAVGQKAQKEGK